MIYDILIVGGGPAGLTAALYARRNGASVLLLEKEGFGGQMAFAPLVENYPGLPPTPGAELAERMLTQVLDLDVDTEIGTAVSVKDMGGFRRVETEEGDAYDARAVILAPGARHRQLGVPGEEELLGSGVSYCAVCDGSFYRDCDVAVVGGGDSALQEALLLSGICRSVTLIHRRRTFRGDMAKQAQLRARENVLVLTPASVQGLLESSGSLRGLLLRDEETGDTYELAVDALFVSIGQEPALEAFADILPLDGAGFADVSEGGVTPAKGVFVAGDCRKKSVRQITTAAADGAMAAMNALAYLQSLS